MTSEISQVPVRITTHFKFIVEEVTAGQLGDGRHQFNILSLPSNITANYKLQQYLVLNVSTHTL
jgi:hypothetical protein